MKIVRFSFGGEVSYGILKGNSIQAIAGEPFSDIETTGRKYKLGEVKLLSPCQPSKIVALGLNYHSHAKEFNLPIPDAPLIFLKPSTAVIGPEAKIVYPPSSHRVDYEGELAVVIKKPVWCVSREAAPDYILGYTCFNDVTARDLQKTNGQWTRAKGFDTFAAVGPCIETEFDPGNAVLETWLNGERRQRVNTNDLIYGVFELVDFISHVMTMLPGDIIATGTTSGVGPMAHGDTVEVKIESIGTLRNHVVKNSG